jgi:hypothetical protein
MSTLTSSVPDLFDQAAVFGAALSLWKACHVDAERSRSNLSEIFDGIDQLMRLVIRIGNQFEAWSCQHIDFNEITEVWPYLLEDKFGDACMDIVPLITLDAFDDRYCLRIAMRLRLPIKADANFPIPVDVTAPNPASDSPFRMFRIQTVRDAVNGRDVSAYGWDDDPFDEQFGKPYFGLYGVCDDQTVEHIADRETYSEAVSLAKKLVPGIDFPLC